MKQTVKFLWLSILLTIFSSVLFAQESKIDRPKLLQELLAYKNESLFTENNYEVSKKLDETLILLAYDKKKLEERRKFPIWRVRYVTQTNLDQENPKYVVVEAPAFIMLPGQEIYHLYFFNKNANLLDKIDFSTGWRMLVNGFSLEKSEWLDFPIIKISANGGGGFAYASSSTQYYALLEDSVVLVRLESKSNSIWNLDNRNSYGCEYPSIGPKLPNKSVAEWKTSLNSDNKVEILQTLMFLAGKHENLESLNQEQRNEEKFRKQNPEDNLSKTTLERCPEILKDIEIYEELKNSKDVQKRLKELSMSSNQWIKESATLALTPIERKTRAK